MRVNAMGAEAEHERSTRLGEGPDTGPLLRTLLRLRHDLVIIGAPARARRRPAFGSLSHYLVRRSSVPVLVVHSEPPRRQAVRLGAATRSRRARRWTTRSPAT